MAGVAGIVTDAGLGIAWWEVMTDIFDRETRSWVMSRVKGRDTGPERVVRSLLHGLGYRFTVNGPKNRKLPGKPDIVLPKYGTVVFVHGCFWHGHRGCKHHRVPKTRSEWWAAKIEGNRRRDAANVAALGAMGWKVALIWTCELDTVGKRAALAEALPGLVERGDGPAMPLAAEDRAPYGRR